MKARGLFYVSLGVVLLCGRQFAVAQRLFYVSLGVVLLCGRQFAVAQPAGVILPDTAEKLTAHVYMIHGFPNVAVIVGTTGTLVVDTGLGPRNGETVARVVARLAKSPKLYLTTTHFHPEHAAGESGFPAGTILIRATIQQEELERDKGAMLARFRERPTFSGLLNNVTYRKPDIEFDRDYPLSLGDVDVDLLYRGPAHTRGDEEVLVKQDSVLVTGDVVQNKTGPAFMAEGVGPADWLATVKALEPLHPRLIVPDHSPPGSGPMLIRQEEDFLEALDSRAHSLKSQGIPVEQAGEVLNKETKQKYPDWNIGDLSDAVARAYAEVP